MRTWFQCKNFSRRTSNAFAPSWRVSSSACFVIASLALVACGEGTADEHDASTPAMDAARPDGGGRDAAATRDAARAGCDSGGECRDASEASDAGGPDGADGLDAGTLSDSSASEADASFCDGGPCVCLLTSCGGECVDTSSNPMHCGLCGHACAADETCTGGACALATWDRSWPVTSGRINAIARDPAGNLYVTGTFEGTVDFGGGPLASAAFSTDTFVASFDARGGHRWSRHFGSGEGRGLAIDGADNVYVTGLFRGTVDFGGGSLVSEASDVFVVSLTGSGVHRWSRGFGATGAWFDVGTAISVSGTGTTGVVYVVGSFGRSAGFEDPTGGTIDFGGGAMTSTGFSDIFVASFGLDGAHRWSRGFGGACEDVAQGVDVDSSGDVYVAGGFGWTAFGCASAGSSVDFGGGVLTSAGEDVFVASFTSAGVHRWSRRYGTSGDERAWAVAADGASSLYVAGWFGGTLDLGGGPRASAGGYDGFLASYDRASSTHRWSLRFGTAFPDEGGRGVLVDSGGVTVTGACSGADFGGGAVATYGFTDIPVATLSASDGTHVASRSLGTPLWDRGLSIAASDRVLYVAGVMETDDRGRAGALYLGAIAR